jgi:hypothetical protein
MDLITAATMASLVGEDRRPCVSLYLPTARSGRETTQGPIRLKNLLQQARLELVDTGRAGREADALLTEAEDLVGGVDFWSHQDDGLAVFVAPDRTERFRLPVRVEELVVVADAFHVKPLWPVLRGEEAFFLLALSRNEVRLLRADRYGITDVDLPDEIPTSLAAALWFDDPERQLQSRAAGRVGQGRVTAQFHGHGASDERDDAKLGTFLRAVDRGVAQLLDPGDPLLLAGVDEVVGVYRRESDHGSLLDDAVLGNPDALGREELHRRALPIMQAEAERAVEADRDRYRSSGPRSAAAVTDVVPAALDGRIDTLFLPVGTQVWGRVAEDGTVSVHDARQPGDRDLLDLAAAATWTARGRVRVVGPEDVPGGGELAAILRY